MDYLHEIKKMGPLPEKYPEISKRNSRKNKVREHSEPVTTIHRPKEASPGLPTTRQNAYGIDTGRHDPLHIVCFFTLTHKKHCHILALSGFRKNKGPRCPE